MSEPNKKLTAAEVLWRYKDEELPYFVSMELTDVNQVGLFYEQPLHVASTRGNIEEILALLEGGANINASGEFGFTPLHAAVGQGHFDAVKLLVEHGALVIVEGEWGGTPLDFAVRSGREDIINLLTKHDQGRFDNKLA